MTVDTRANAAVQAAIDAAIANGEIGVQVAAYLNGELVVDAFGGVADPATGRLVDGDTLFNVFSVTKAVAATAVHVQAERGLVDYDAPIATYWPEFAANGKDGITVRHALTHRTGTPQMPDDTTPQTICDWDTTCVAIANLTPILPIGKAPAYQSMSFGWILGEIVRRTDPQNRTFDRFVQEEIAEPFGVADLWLGAPDSVADRIATLVDDGSSAPGPEGSLFVRSLPNSVRLIPEVFEMPTVRRACIPAVGGIFSARSEARFWAILAQKGALDGRRLLSEARVEAACRPRNGPVAPDPVYFNAVMALSEGGYWLGSQSVPFVYPVGSPTAICCPGAGASIGWADPETGLAVAFCHNRMTRPTTGPAHPFAPIADVIRSSLGLA